MAPTYEQLGVQGAEALGLALATVGLLTSTLVGGLLVVMARWRGWVAEPAVTAASALQKNPGSLAAVGGQTLADSPQATPFVLQVVLSKISAWALNLGLAGLAVALGWVLLQGLRALAPHLGTGVATVIEALPVFPLALVGSVLVRLVLERSGTAKLASGTIQNRIGTLSADLLITAATACLDLSSLSHLWKPLLVLGVAGLLWNLLVVLGPGRWMLPQPWFERGLIDFGQATGVAASGLLLLNMADPKDQGDVLTPFSIKQLLLQPFVAGGVITVVAPLAVSRWGLPAWTTLCLVLVVLWVGLAVGFGRGRSGVSAPLPPHFPHPP
jgi:ESS family glutamate:Na+ symporter